MRRQFCPRVALDCCNIDRRAGTEHADAMANGNGLSHADLGADSRPELAPGGHQFFCSCCRTVLSLRTAAPAAAKEPTTDPIAAAATGSAGDGAVQSSAGKSGRSPAAPARWGVSAGGGMVRPKSWRFSAQRVSRARLGAALETGRSSSPRRSCIIPAGAKNSLVSRCEMTRPLNQLKNGGPASFFVVYGSVAARRLSSRKAP